MCAAFCLGDNRLLPMKMLILARGFQAGPELSRVPPPRSFQKSAKSRSFLLGEYGLAALLKD